MGKFINGIVKKRKSILIIFLILTVLCIFFALRVKVNYNIRDYLPADTPSTEALDILDKSFSFSMPNARAEISVDGVEDALRFKEKLQNTEGIIQVLWLDDTIDLQKPLEIQDKKAIETFYKNNKALFQLTAETENAAQVVERIYRLDDSARISGELVDLANAQVSVETEMLKITAFVVPLVFIVLLLSTHAWLEPLAFALAIGVGIALNMGTNIFLGQISFISQAISAVLQLAVSMDYAIFLLNRFNSNRSLGYAPQKAMIMAMKRAFVAVFSSAITTTFGFLALIFMRFGIGSDLGIVMAKGIVFSFISIMIFMPCLVLGTYKLIDKTVHKSLLPDFEPLGKLVFKSKGVFIVLAALIIVPAFLGSRANDFIYGMGGYPSGSKMLEDKIGIEEDFGQQQQLSLMVPKGSITGELEVLDKLKAEDWILSVMTYTNTVDPAIPQEVLSDSQLEMLLSDEYTQFIITAAINSEGEAAFNLVEHIRQIAGETYGDDYHLIGQAAAMLDMKDTIEKDNIIVNGLAILAIGLVILLAFRSISLPVILVLIIEVAIWINLSISYFTGTTLSYIGYLIISTVQLGATVDYAILYTEHYLEHRKVSSKEESLIQSIRETVPSLLPPALILMIAGFILRIISSLAIVSELGLVLGRGAVLSFLMVIFVLPGILYILDRIIEKTTWKLKFFKQTSAKKDSMANADMIGGQDVSNQ